MCSGKLDIDLLCDLLFEIIVLKTRFFRSTGTYQNWLKPLRVVGLDVGAWRVVSIDIRGLLVVNLDVV